MASLLTLISRYLLPVLLIAWLLLLVNTQAMAAYTSSVIPETAFDNTTINVVWSNNNTNFPVDDDHQVVSIGFNFSFGGVSYTQTRIISNGMLHFGAGQAVHQPYNNSSLPTGVGDRLVLPYWDDLDPSAGGTVSYGTFGTAPNRRFVATWNNVPRYNLPGTRHTFQVVLYETGNILYRYGSDNANGSSATIGIEEDDSDFTLFSFNTISVSDAEDILWQPQLSGISRVTSDCLATDQILVVFDAPITSGVVDDIANYSLDNGVTISAATIISSTTVRLDTSGFIQGTTYNLVSINPSQTVNFIFGVTTIADQFSTVSYGNNDGSTNWSGNWIENQELGGGGGPTSGNITITGGALRMDDRPNSGGQPNVSREIDLTGHTSATLTFDYQTSNNLENGDRFNVAVSNNGGASYTIVQTYSNDGSGTQSIDLTPFISNNTRVRFMVQTGYGGSSEAMLIDNVGIIAIPDSSLCLANVDHYSITHSGLGVTCEAEPVIITAHDSADLAMAPSSSTTITLSTSIANDGWALIIGTGNGTFTPPDQYTFDGIETSVEFWLSKTTAVTGMDIDVTDGSATDQDGDAIEDVDIDFVDSAFRFYADGVQNSIATQIAGKTSSQAPNSQILSLRAIQTNTDTGACEAILTNSQSVDITLQCTNPNSCQRPIYMGTASPSTMVTGTAAVTLDFGDATQAFADFVLNYPDAGEIQLSAQHTLPNGFVLNGISNPFVVRPFGFDIDVPGNPGATDATGLKFIAAGSAFTVNVSAALWNNVDDSDNDGIPDNHDDADPANNVDLSNNSVTLGVTSYTGTPNFGLEGEEITLSAVLFDPSGGNDPGLTGGTLISSFALGAGGSTTARYDEVGIIEITAAISDSDYLGTGGVMSQSGHVGRFYPAFFQIIPENGMFANSCSTGAMPFTYIGETFFYGAIHPSFEVRAMNALATPTVTQNYTGPLWAKLDDSSVALTSPSADGTQNGSDGTTPMPITYTQDTNLFNINEISGGVFNFEFANDEFVYDRGANSEISQFDSDINLTITAVTDLDSVTTTSAFTLTPDSAHLRFGRIKMSNVHGSELIDLQMPMIVEYLDPSGAYTINGHDTCTTVITGDLSITDNLSTSGASTVSVTNSPILLGDLGVTLTAPGVGVDGNIIVSPSLTGVADWLQYEWDTSIGVGPFDDDPSATATFGIYRGNDVNIYQIQTFQ